MVSTFRKKLRNWVMLGILGLALIALVITGFGTDGMGGIGGMSGQSTQTVATVGDEKITDGEISRRMNDLFSRVSQEQPTLDRAGFFDSSFGELLDQLISREALIVFARKMGFVVPERMVDFVILQLPGVTNVVGQYDPLGFQRYLESVNLTERELRAQIQEDYLVRLVISPVSGSARIGNTLTSEYANLQLETRTGQLGGVPTALLAAGLQPSDPEVTAFYQQNQRLFQLPERRVVKFALIGRDQLGEGVRASDQEVVAYYQQNQAKYGPGETRNMQLFTTQDEAAARRLVEQVRGGMPFVQAAQAAGFTPEDVNLPNLNRQQFTQRSSQELANAAFEAQQGSVLGPMRTRFGIQVARIDGITRTPGQPLETVRGEIVAAVEQRKLSEQINARIEAIEELLRDGSSLEEVARAQGLTLQTSPPITATGAGPNFQFPQELGPLLQAAFEFGPDEDPVVEVVQPDRQAALFQTAQIIPPAAPPLEQIRDQVRQRLIQQTALQRAKAIADSIVARINGGMPPAQAYAQAGLRLPSPLDQTHRRFELSRPGQRVPPPLTILFAIPEGRARTVQAPDGQGWIIVHHLRRTAGNAARDPLGQGILSSLQAEMMASAGRELQDQFARAVQGAVEVTRNEEQIEALRQRLRTGQ